MSEFFFSYRAGHHLARDLEGTELPSLKRRPRDGCQIGSRTSSRCVKVDRRPPDAVIITTEDGDDIMTISMSEVLPEPLRK
jgi:hypothetical protein